jgi:hypothetical protein
MVRIASRFPVNLYFCPERSVRAKSPVIGVPERQPVSPVPEAAFSLPLAPVEPAEEGFEAGGVFGWFVGGFVLF